MWLLVREARGARTDEVDHLLEERGAMFKRPAVGAGPVETAVRPLNPLAARPASFPGAAKHVIWLFMNGGPSQVDTWDYKPDLEKHDGQALKDFDKDTGFFTDQVGPIMRSPFKFRQYGKSGT